VIPWAIADTGPIVAFLDKGQAHHAWVKHQIRSLHEPLLTCEPVLTEAAFLLARIKGGRDGLFGLLRDGALKISFSLSDHIEDILALCQKYHDLPMSLADSCLVRMAELHERHAVFTLDSDFRVYRKNGRDAIPLITPG
jgi:predicted nucleic acid-binding protein